MPPRFVYWTILIDGKATAFRARDLEELLPTVHQLKRKNQDVVVKWFAHGKLWESPEAERAAQYRPMPPPETRGRDWRPGGHHKDPRDRFKKKNRPERAWSEADRDRDRPPSRRGSSDRQPSGGGWQNKPGGHPAGKRRPWQNKPAGPPRSDRPWRPKPAGDRKPWQNKPASPPPNDRPWQTKPTGPRADRKPWQPKRSGPARHGGLPDRSSDRRTSEGGGRQQTSGRPPFRRDRPPFPKKKRDDDPDKS